MIIREPRSSSSYLFNVDILIEDESNARALERLLSLLNRSGAADFRIQSGIELGKMIDALTMSSGHLPPSVPGPHLNLVPPIAEQTAPSNESSLPADAEAVSSAQVNTLAADQRIRAYIEQNKLIRLLVNKGLGVRLSIPCRIISFDEMTGNVTVYHVDEKQVYTFSINEVDDFVE
ncbi:hypothetical protein PA598K_01403 [Paenibacillus sp. 598K]|uniref:hypothetical protein n=1 Tax=Paenibacillus sp. 598K TaxID=1117987 RepID=UPI000FFA1CC6|nr:hypothetical protein [Paenibacillus sp. 598K]GBF73118.1 hypothetical protein PA598K_01403 [Paenibacillus sp. 598K]